MTAGTVACAFRVNLCLIVPLFDRKNVKNVLYIFLIVSELIY